MSKEQLESIEMLAKARLLVGGSHVVQILAEYILLLSKTTRDAWSEIERLNNHLNPKPENQ